jgi:hypothetical protein
MPVLNRRSFLQLSGLTALSSAFPDQTRGSGLAPTSDANGPLRLDARNPHYFFFQGKPLVLIGSGEHYGSVMNTAFNYSRYVEAVAKAGLNQTRLFSGVYHEVPGDFGIVKNTLGPEPKYFICPWVRSDTPGALDGLNKFDLSRWNSDYFTRLVDFMRVTAEHNVIVEMNIFCPFYQDRMWNVSPLNAKNNINGIGDMDRTDVYTLKNSRMQALQDEMTKRILAAIGRFDNFYYEICNEPYFGGVTLEWQKHIARLIVDTEALSSKQHLISQNIANGSTRIVDPDPLVSIFNFHYSRPPESVAMNYGLNKAIGINETGFDGTDDAPYRIEAWDFLVAGGALYSNLDYSFVAGYEDGTFTDKHAGGGGVTLRQQLAFLLRFISSYDFVRMAPSPQVLKSVAPSGASVRVLAEPGKAYAIYMHHGHPSSGVKVGTVGYSLDSVSHQEQLGLDLPAGSYRAEWTNTKTATVDKKEQFRHPGGLKTLASPEYKEDIALRLIAK